MASSRPKLLIDFVVFDVYRVGRYWQVKPAMLINEMCYAVVDGLVLIFYPLTLLADPDEIFKLYA